MSAMPAALTRLIEDLNRLPGIGRKTASRLAMHILRRPAEEARNLARDLAELHRQIRLCSRCFAFSETEPCRICSDPARDQHLVCVVEGTDEMLAIEKTGIFRGLYHVLHGVLSPGEGIGPEELKIENLTQRVKREGVREVLVATSSTVPGEATAAYLIRHLSEHTRARVTRLAYGIPMGMDIKYADDLTLAKAIESRREVEV